MPPRDSIPLTTSSGGPAWVPAFRPANRWPVSVTAGSPDSGRRPLCRCGASLAGVGRVLLQLQGDTTNYSGRYPSTERHAAGHVRAADEGVRHVMWILWHCAIYLRLKIGSVFPQYLLDKQGPIIFVFFYGGR